jgi:hypothetical protein
MVSHRFIGATRPDGELSTVPRRATIVSVASLHEVVGFS